MRRILFLFTLIFVGSFTFSCKNLEHKKAGEPEVYAFDMQEISIVANPSYRGSATKFFRLKHTRLEIKPLWIQRALEGTAELTLTPYAYPQDTLVLDAKAFELRSVDLIFDKQESKPLNHTYDKQKLQIALGRTYKVGEEIRIRIKYVAKPESQLDEGIIKRKSDQGLYFIDPEDIDPYLPRQLWTQGEVKNNSAWFPTIDEPNQKFTQQIYLTVDSSFETLSNGALVYSTLHKDGTRTDLWEQTQPHSPYLTMIAAGDWHIEKDNWRDSIPVEYYVEKQYAKHAPLIFGHTPEMMEFYSKLVGVDYPWAKYSQVVVREFVSGAMENTTATVHFEPLQHDDRAHLDETYESIIAHELFHHWFGDLVTAESWSNLALNESFATYGERLWDEHKYGKDAMDYGRQQDLDAYLSETIYTKESIINHYYNDAEDLFDRHRYEKGGLVLHMLRTVLGDEVFFPALKNYLQQNAFKSVEIAQLRIAYEEASGQDLTWFFDQWFNKSGHPVLNISQKYNKEKGELTVIVTQSQKDENIPNFKMPVDLHIYTPGKMLQHKIWIGKSRDSFVFAVPQEPLLVNFDAQKYLLAQKTDVKPAKQWYYQFLNAKNYFDRYEAIYALSDHTALLGEDSLSTLITTALKDPFWNIRRRAIDALLANSNRRVQEKFAPEIKQAALYDKNSRVRFSAFTYMQNRKAFFGHDIYADALKDSSYQVVAAAIHGLRTHTPGTEAPLKMGELARFENYKSSEVLFALAQFYAEYPDTFKIDFFHTIPKNINSGEYGRFADVYKHFMDKMPAEIIMQEKDFILSMVPKINDMWAKVSYKSMLAGFAERLRATKRKPETEAADVFLKASQSIQLNAE